VVALRGAQGAVLFRLGQSLRRLPLHPPGLL
jgi:hypothetical protein